LPLSTASIPHTSLSNELWALDWALNALQG
jgi:hypothetical protein